MITTIDSSLYPTFLRTYIATTLGAEDIIWATEELALRKRREQMEKSEGSITDMLPFISFVREDPITPLDDRNQVVVMDEWVYLGKTSQEKKITAMRVEFSYSTIYHCKKVSPLIVLQKNLLRTLRKTNQLTYEITNTDMDFGYEFTLDNTDESGIYYTEEIFETGYLQELMFTVICRAWLVEDEGTASGIISQIDLDLYGYDAYGASGVVDPAAANLEDSIVLT